MEKKYCFKTDGTQLTDSKIATALGLLGAKNIGQFSFVKTVVCYYFLLNDGFINYDTSIPKGYKLTDVDEFLAQYKPNPFPKKMWVSDESEDDARKNKLERLVIVYCSILNYPWIAVIPEFHSFISRYKYAVDIPEKKEEPVVELTLDQIAEKFNISVDKLKIKK